MAKKIGREAAIPNAALKPFSVLIGTWNTIGTHPYIPDVTLHGLTSFKWLEGGAFIIIRSEIDEPRIPSAVAIFGSDDATGEYFELYFDERGVSRKIEVSFSETGWNWWRNTPEFSQRFTVTFADNGDTMISKGELSRDGRTWEKDLELTYKRVKKKRRLENRR
jgi:hypothetical protein